MRFRRRSRRPAAPADQLADVRVTVLADDDPGAARRAAARDADLRLLRRIAAEATIVQDDAEALLVAVRGRGPLAELAPRGGELSSRFVALEATLPRPGDPVLAAHAAALREVLRHHALVLSTTMGLLAVAWRSARLEEELDKVGGLGRQAERLDALRAELNGMGSALPEPAWPLG
jgi:hypothetical protein